jgi:hypothetical protein
MYFVVFVFSYFAGIFMFNYLAWKREHLQQFVDLYGFEMSNLDLLALKDTPHPSHSCVLPDTICKRVSADMFLVSIIVWSSMEVIRWWLTKLTYKVTYNMIRENLLSIASVASRIPLTVNSVKGEKNEQTITKSLPETLKRA